MGLSCMHRHPLNVEPTPTALMKYGFITPASLHYVRNHGPVPKIKWSQHKLEINGLVERPTTFTMDQLLSTFEHVDVLCTLTCAGNRRKARSQNTLVLRQCLEQDDSSTILAHGTSSRLLSAMVIALQWQAHAVVSLCYHAQLIVN